MDIQWRRKNPDSRLRQAEKRYAALPTYENLELLNHLRILIGLEMLAVCKLCKRTKMVGPVCEMCNKSVGKCHDCFPPMGYWDEDDLEYDHHRICDPCKTCITCGTQRLCPLCVNTTCNVCDIGPYCDNHLSFAFSLCASCEEEGGTNQRYCRNPDDEFRHLERLAASGDVEAEASYLSTRVRHGKLDPKMLLLAAYLGHPASLRSVPDPNPYVLLKQIESVSSSYETDPDAGADLTMIGQVLYSRFLDKDFLINIAADFVEHVLPIWDISYGENKPLTEALRAARENVSFGEASRIRWGLAFTEDPYQPGAMEVGENALRLVEMARYNADAQMVTPMNAMRWLARSIAKGCETAAGYVSKNWPSWDMESEQQWQREHLINILLA